MIPKEDSREKRAYEKPELIVIDLSADEVLAIGCKSLAMGHNFGGSPCSAYPCSNIGS
jgi:hypothetical protein